MIQKYDIELHNEIRWLIEDYVGEFDLKRELVDRIIEKVKEAVSSDVEQLEQQNKNIIEILNKQILIEQKIQGWGHRTIIETLEKIKNELKKLEEL